ncbi:ATP-grasp domain-containing protein [Paenibacillus xylanexedens]|uniref:ATP-grasp domain-containing protein n=1 Tax=Paenibacillus xylanexedens TaxID=528191 RepID=UPI000F538763|nr:ATP-grasp domain-containing protein [Paenibacillus xylanexedens]RPK27799.1 hypothetical protein EDO6_03322 [Paenibacillus xylanexedens]
MRQFVIIVESGNRGAEIPSFKAMGYDVILLTSGIIPYDHHYVEQASKVITDKKIVQLEYLTHIINELHSIHSVKTVCSTSDFFIHPVSLICEIYQYPFLNSKSSVLFHQKDEFRKKQKELNFNHPEFHTFHEITDAVQFYRASNNGKWIFKPINGNESVAVQLIKSEQELVDCYQRLKYLSRYTGTLYKASFLLEEFVEGDIYSCEFMVSKGRVQILGVTGRYMSPLPYFIELGYVFPVHGPVEDQIIEETKRFIREFQYDQGACHIEYIISTNNVVYILEVNPRLIGPPNPWMIDRALDISVFDRLCSLLVTGELPELVICNPRYSVCYEVTSPISGYLNGIQIEQRYLDDKDHVHIIILKENKQYIEKATSNTDIIARILTVADSIQEAQRLADEIYGSIRIEMSIQPCSIMVFEKS